MSLELLVEDGQLAVGPASISVLSTTAPPVTETITSRPSPVLRSSSSTRTRRSTGSPG